MSQTARKFVRRSIAALAGAFGIMTIVSGGSVALRLGASRDLAGDVVPFVVWFNFAAGFAYLAAAIAIWTGQSWARPLSVAIAAATALVAAGFAVSVLTGQAFEIRTVGALGLRFFVWAGIATWLMREARA